MGLEAFITGASATIFDVDVDRIYIPINQNNTHWVLVVVHMQRKVIQYYDPFHEQAGDEYLKVILRWLNDEHKSKSKTELPLQDNWALLRGNLVRVLPKQTNGKFCTPARQSLPQQSQSN